MTLNMHWLNFQIVKKRPCRLVSCVYTVLRVLNGLQRPQWSFFMLKTLHYNFTTPFTWFKSEEKLCILKFCPSTDYFFLVYRNCRERSLKVLERQLQYTTLKVASWLTNRHIWRCAQWSVPVYVDVHAYILQ